MRILLFLLICAHIGFFSMLVGSKPYRLNKASRPLVVKTLALPSSNSKATPLTQKMPNSVKAIAPSVPKKVSLTQKAPSPVKSTVKKKSVVTNERKKAALPAKKPTQEFQIPSSILKQLEESIAKIEQKYDKQCKSNTSVAAFLPFKVTADFAQEEQPLPDYTASLVKELTQALKLPEYGEVKVKLTINPMGKIIELLVIQTESTANKLYLEKHLPHIVLPKYHEKAALIKNQTFTLTFCNAL